jgi:hypothetical protein
MTSVTSMQKKKDVEKSMVSGDFYPFFPCTEALNIEFPTYSMKKSCENHGIIEFQPIYNNRFP